MIPTREEAWELVTEYTTSDSLRRHMLAVEAAMRAYAKRFSEDPAVWGVVGLLHDFDYERYPDISANGHPSVGATLLRERGVDEEIVQIPFRNPQFQPATSNLSPRPDAVDTVLLMLRFPRPPVSPGEL